MKVTWNSIVHATLVGFAIAGCQTDKHTMVQPAPDTRVVCQQCYTQVVKVRSQPGGRWSGPDRTVETHQCMDCKTEMSVYTENGVLKVKCDHCAPAGMACDKCLPPASATK